MAGLAFGYLDEELTFRPKGMSAFGDILLCMLFRSLWFSLKLLSLVLYQKLFELYDFRLRLL